MLDKGSKLLAAQIAGSYSQLKRVWFTRQAKGKTTIWGRGVVVLGALFRLV